MGCDTYAATHNNSQQGVSIHAPTWGATKMSARTILYQLFQSTHPLGVRHTAYSCGPAYSGFNPRTHSGCDFVLYLFLTIPIGFNPRTHSGCDPGFGLISQSTNSFNPRTHSGCDATCYYNRSTILFVSIHAPTRGATHYCLHFKLSFQVSIHAPTRGATCG